MEVLNCYVVSDNAATATLRYPHLLQQSIRDLRRFKNPGEILVIHVPPVNRNFVGQMVQAGIPVLLRKKHPIPWNLAMKLYFADVRAEHLITMDVDTRVWKNPRKLYSLAEFRVAARPDPINKYKEVKDFSRERWDGLFAYLDIPWQPLLSNGFNLYTGNAQRLLRKPWAKYLKMLLKDEIPNPMNPRYMEMVSWTLAVAETFREEEIWHMGAEHHGLERYEGSRCGYVMDIQRSKK